MKIVFQLVLNFSSVNPISTVIFFDACVPGGGPVGPPLEMAFLQQKCANFGPEVKFDKILAIF